MLRGINKNATNTKRMNNKFYTRNLFNFFGQIESLTLLKRSLQWLIKRSVRDNVFSPSRSNSWSDWNPNIVHHKTVQINRFDNSTKSVWFVLKNNAKQNLELVCPLHNLIEGKQRCLPSKACNKSSYL